MKNAKKKKEFGEERGRTQKNNGSKNKRESFKNQIRI